MNKLLTVSIAAYNVADYLKDALDSIVGNRNCANLIEVIIVNDGSKDETIDIAREYEKKYPNTILVIDKKNGGYGSTINSSVRIASGKYYKLLDGDDWFNENLEDYLDKLEKEESDLVLSPYYRVYIGEKRNELIDRHNSKAKGNFGVDEGKLIYIHAAEAAVRTECIRNRLTISENRFYTDTEYAYYISAYSKSISYLNIPIYCYRIGREGQSIGVESRIKHRQDASLVALRLCEDYQSEKNEYLPQIVDGQLSQIAKTIVFYCKTLMLMDDGKTSKREIKEFLNIIEAYPEIMERVKSIDRYIGLYIRFPFLFSIISKNIKFKEK